MDIRPAEAGHDIERARVDLRTSIATAVGSAMCWLGLSVYMTPGDGFVWLAIGLLTGLFVAVTPILVAVRAVRRTTRLRRDLVLQLQSAGDAERTRLAHELHDDFAQKLAALKMQLELDHVTGQSRRSTPGSIEAVDGLIRDIRELSRSLRPAPFEEGQLIPALATLAKAEGRRAGLRVLVDTPVTDVPLSREAEVACYRVVREAVTNIVKHARAHHVMLSVLARANIFSVRVVDDGAGFDVAPAARQAPLDGHLGLMGMKERLQQVGGTLKIRSSKGGGTIVECRVPMTASI